MNSKGICLAVVILSSVFVCHGYGGAANMSALLRTLFEEQGFNPLVRPSRDYARPTHVTVQMVMEAVLGVDLKQQTMKTNGFLYLSWYDELTQWNPDNFGGLRDINVPVDKLWHPDLIFYNTIQPTKFVDSFGGLCTITYYGLVLWTPGFNLETTCKFDVTKYPFDVNSCPVRIMNWANDNRSIHLDFLESGAVTFTTLMENGEYYIEPGDSYKHINIASDRSDIFYEELYFYLKLSRRPEYFVLSLLMPVMLLAVMCSTSFLLDPDEQDKLTVAITVLLSFTVFMGVIDQDMPKTSDNISLLAMYVSGMLAVGFMCVLGNVVVIKCDRWEKSKQCPVQTENDEITKDLTGTSFSTGKELDLTTSQSDLQLAENDGLSNQSASSKDSSNFPAMKRLCNLMKRKRLASILNRALFVVNLTTVACLTALLWILMLN